MTDGFQVFKCQCNGSTTWWPIIAINFNLPPEEHTKLSNILPLAIIPGPKAPKDSIPFFSLLLTNANSFLWGNGHLTLSPMIHSNFMHIQFPFMVTWLLLNMS